MTTVAVAAPPLRERLREFWRWARFPFAIGAGSRFALFLIGWWGMVRRPNHAQQLNDYPFRPYLDTWFSWDAGWYLNIMKNGYTLFEPEPGQRNTVFFPLYPMTVKATSAVLHIDLAWASVLVSAGAFVAASVVFYRWVMERWGIRTAQSSLLLMATAPYAFYFNACYTESLFLLVLVSAFYAAQRQRWLLAGLFLALASATRLVGIVGMFGVAMIALEQVEWKPLRLSWKVVSIWLGVLGVGAFALYLGVTLGDPMLFAANNVPGWSAGHDFVADLRSALNLQGWLTGRLRIAEAEHIFSLAFATLVALTSRKRLGMALVLFCLALLFLYWRVYFSASRYVLTMFPLYVSVALLLRKHRLALTGLIAFDATLLGVFTFMYGQREWIS